MSGEVTTNVYVKTWINYNNLLNKPIINNVELVGNLSLEDLNIQSALTAGTAISLTDGQINVLVDAVLSDSSTNPVQNNVVKAAIDNKQDKLNNAQVYAINSGITSNKVNSYNGHLLNIENPHSVTATQVGLGNVNNTSDLDKPISTATQTALDGKQATLTETQMTAVNSGIDNSKVGQITTNQSNISTINEKIPSQASSSNQLADKNFVNSSISTNTSNFIGTFNSLADLEAYSGTLTNNDYAFVISTDTDGNTIYNRYKYTTATQPASWVFEYALNNSSFTAAQWEAINSEITATLVGQITTNQSNITDLQTNKLDVSVAATTYIPLTQKGIMDGVAELDINAKVPLNQLPIDDALSPTSENPVQNKVIYAAFGDIESLLNNINSGNN